MGDIREETIEAINLMENYHSTPRGAIEVHFSDGHVSPSFFRLSPGILKMIEHEVPNFKPGMPVSNAQMASLRANTRASWKFHQGGDALSLNLLTEFGKAIKKASETVVREHGKRGQFKGVTIGYRRKKYRY